MSKWQKPNQEFLSSGKLISFEVTFARTEIRYARQRSQLLLQRVETLVYKYESVLRSNISILSTIAQKKKREWILHSLHTAALMQMAT